MPSETTFWPSESTFCALRINILVWHPSLGRKSVYYNHHRHNHHYLWCLVVVSPLFCALFTGNMTVFAKCLTLAYSFMKNSPFWMMMIIIITLVIVMMLIICISSTFSLKVHLKSHHNHYNQDYPHHDMHGGGEAYLATSHASYTASGLWTLLHDDDDLHHQQDHHHRHYHEIHNIHHHSMITDDLCQIIEIVPESTHLLIRILLFNCNFLQIWLIWFCLKSESRTLTKNQG